ncbi:unnamed protein product [Lampetra fluviatilis]
MGAAHSLARSLWGSRTEVVRHHTRSSHHEPTTTTATATAIIKDEDDPYSEHLCRPARHARRVISDRIEATTPNARVPGFNTNALKLGFESRFSAAWVQRPDLFDHPATSFAAKAFADFRSSPVDLLTEQCVAFTKVRAEKKKRQV